MASSLEREDKRYAASELQLKAEPSPSKKVFLHDMNRTHAMRMHKIPRITTEFTRNQYQFKQNMSFRV